MSIHYEENTRVLRRLTEKISTIEKIVLHNSGALIQPKWVDSEAATTITGMGVTWLKQRQVTVAGKFNPIGIFRTRLQGKKTCWYKKDLDAYERYQAGEAPEPEPIQLKLYTANPLKKAM